MGSGGTGEDLWLITLPGSEGVTRAPSPHFPGSHQGAKASPLCCQLPHVSTELLGKSAPLRPGLPVLEAPLGSHPILEQAWEGEKGQTEWDSGTTAT